MPPTMRATPRRRWNRKNQTKEKVNIVVEDYRPCYDLLSNLSNQQLVVFLHTFAKGQVQVSYVLQPSRESGTMVTEDVQSAE